MAQITINPTLLHQIDAGTKGRKKGHSYEDILASKINAISKPYNKGQNFSGIIHHGSPISILLDKVLDYLKWEYCDDVKAYATGKLATSEDKIKEIIIEGQSITSTKSDLILILNKSTIKKIIGVSVKQCNNKTPTNAQVFFTTATAFYNLIKENVINLSEKALLAMQQFCGDNGFRPDNFSDCSNRVSSPERYFWEEIDSEGKAEWEHVFTTYQDDVTRLLLQKAYQNDPFPPEIILHKTKKAKSFEDQEIAIFTMNQFITLSKKYSSFTKNSYRVIKGRYREPKGITHEAPRFGVIQMQRGGQKQHPTQLQFNLKAGYFYLLDKM